MSEKTSVMFGDCRDIYKEIDSLEITKFIREIKLIDITKIVDKKWSNTDPDNFYFEGVNSDKSILSGTSDNSFALELAIKFLEIADYDKRAIELFKGRLKLAKMNR